MRLLCPVRHNHNSSALGHFQSPLDSHGICRVEIDPLILSQSGEIVLEVLGGAVIELDRSQGLHFLPCADVLAVLSAEMDQAAGRRR